MHPLKDYLKKIGASHSVFARALGISTKKLDDVLGGRTLLEPSLARRILAAAGDALTLDDLYPSTSGGLVEMTGGRARFAGAPINSERLRVVLSERFDHAGFTLAEGFLDAACEAVENTYVALASVTTRQGPDRLFQALRPVLEEIFADFSKGREGAPQTPLESSELDGMTAEIVALYSQAP